MGHRTRPKETWTPGPSWIRSLRRGLLAFFDRHRRDLPWRRTRDPYRVWVSEIMLQQTRVDTVTPFYERWLERFPTVEALARAEPDDVLHVWQGLGYYTRARNLQRAAQSVYAERNGRLPRSAEELRKLPGIGAYSAGAIASIAFGQREPAIDGNATRVYARLFDLEAATPVTLLARVRPLVPRDRPGEFNQAVMELGSTICKPKKPRCTECPVARLCRAYARGHPEAPGRRKRPARVPAFDVATAVVLDVNGRVLMTRRPERGLLARLWEFPGAQPHAGESLSDAARRAARPHCDTLRLQGGSALGAVPHVFSHRRETYHVFRFQVAASRDWIDPAELDRLAVPAAQRRIARLFL
jgi:A/G-specific adenine glycosylase